jgi:predicted 3-demethylubiquinone-9 3-methyltransferase (glyoxalase superfamily)
MNTDKIVPCIWFAADGGQMSKIVAYYKTVFGENFQAGNVIPLGKTPSGNTEMCEAVIFKQKFSLMSTENEHHPLNDAVSLIINCDDQKEIDRFWNYFTQHGKESQCGWCTDKYGLRWQIIPKNLGELMTKPNAFEVMIKQKKIIIDEYLK